MSEAPLLLLEVTRPTLAENLALDEALLQGADEGRWGELLRIWRWPREAVVLGAGGSLAIDVDVEACRREGVELARRSSGGGTVLLGPGCLLFSLILRYDRHPTFRDVNASYRTILGRLAQALTPWLGEVRHEGICDLTWNGRKFSGNAQQRKRQTLLHHGTLLYDFDLTRMGRFLKRPEREPSYRAQREHHQFVTNVPIGEMDLVNALRDEWQAHHPIELWPSRDVERLIAEKYGQPDWIFRR